MKVSDPYPYPVSLRTTNGAIADSDIIGAPGRTQVFQIMKDYKSHGSWRYQDCDNSKVNLGFYNQVTTPYPDHSAATLTDSGLSEGSGTGERFVVDYPVSLLVQDSSVFLDAMGPSPYSAPSRKGLEAVFSNPRVPKQISIDRDPFDTGFSIWYLLVDAWQFGGLFKSLFGSMTLNRRFRLLDNLDPKATAKQLADDHLMVKFGLIPTIADLRQFCTLVRGWRKRYDDMAAFLRAPRAWHAEPYLLKEDYPVNEDAFIYEGVTSVRRFAITQQPTMYAAVYNRIAVLHRTGSYSFVAPEFMGWMSRLKQFIDAFGVLDPAAIWDIIPFSFIVDWFYGIGNWLHKQRPRLFPADVVLQDYCESIKLERHVTFQCSYKGTRGTDYSLQPVSFINAILCDVTVTNFIRRKYLPPSIDVPIGPGPGTGISISRGLVSASLIAQRLPR